MGQDVCSTQAKQHFHSSDEPLRLSVDDRSIGVSAHNSPRPNFPMLNEAMNHVRIIFCKGFCDTRIGGAKNQECFVGWFSERACENKFSACVGGVCDAEVLRAKWRAAFEIIVNQVVDQCKVRHGQWELLVWIV